jgi:hypothetical protein
MEKARENARRAADRRGDADDREVVSGIPEWMICGHACRCRFRRWSFV